MQQHRMKRLAGVFALAVPLALSGCGDAFGIGDGDFEGRYDYDGDVVGLPFYSIEGEVTIRDERRDEADVDIRWVMRDQNGGVVFSVRSNSSARAYIDRDYIEFEFEGRFDNGNDFLLVHEGTLRGRTMIGSWDLYTEGMGDERGEFRAVR